MLIVSLFLLQTIKLTLNLHVSSYIYNKLHFIVLMSGASKKYTLALCKKNLYVPEFPISPFFVSIVLFSCK